MKPFGLNKKFSWFFVFYVAVFVMPFFGVGCYEIYKIKRLHDDFVRTEGTVVGNSYSRAADDEGGAYHPVIEFEIADGGGKTRFTDGVGSFPPDYAAGERLAVLYNPANPQEARVYSWKRIWLVPGLFIFIGLLPLLVPLGIVLAGWFFLRANKKA